jgi:short-subunit dehydrogenase involved in D-alanine esterification of teichoic acids
MKIKLKRLDDQVIVITGGTSGIGLATAKRAAARGARVVLCSRNEAELRETVAAIEERGGTARSVVADVANHHDVERLAATAVEEFDALDTWVNNRHPDQALDHRHAVFPACEELHVGGAQATCPGLRARGRRKRHPARC